MRVLVCGGRNFDDWELLSEELTYLLGDYEIETIIHGAARGADTMAEEFARAAGIESRPFPADWKTHGRAAGPIRNRRMLEEGRPNLVLAFPGGRGTADMVRQAQKAGIKVKEVNA